MRKIIVFQTVLIISLLCFSLALAKPSQDDVPSYRGLALKAESSCIDACGPSPDNEDIPGSYAYEMCIADCHPKIDFLHDSVDSLQYQIDNFLDTNAGTICASGQYLDGDGTCKTVPIVTDTNAGIIFSL